MHVALPALAGRYGLEWLVREGDVVEAGQVLAWLAVADHCALLPLNAPGTGRLTARWSELLQTGRGGVVVAEIDGDGLACRAAERDALREEREARLERLASMERRASSPAATTLLGPERRETFAWLEACADRLSESAA